MFNFDWIYITNGLEKYASLLLRLCTPFSKNKIYSMKGKQIHTHTHTQTPSVEAMKGGKFDSVV